MLLAAVLVLAIIFSSPSVKGYLHMPSNAASGGIVPPGNVNNSTEISTPDLKFGPIVQLTGQPGFPPDGSYNFPVNGEYTTDMFGDWMTFLWTIKGNDGNEQQIMLYNLKTKEVRQLTNDICGKRIPRIWGNYIVWIDCSSNITLYNISAKTTSQLTTDGGCTGYGELNADIYDNKIVFIKYTYPETDHSIYMIDLSQGTDAVKLPTTQYMKTESVIYGSLVVWLDWRDSGYPYGTKKKIYAYDLVTGLEYPITMADSYKGNLDFWGDTIVWVDDRNNLPGKFNMDVFMYSVSQHQEQKINKQSARVYNPRVNNGYIVYTGYDGDPATSTSLYIYNIAKKQEKVAFGPSFPAIYYGSPIVYTMNNLPKIVWFTVDQVSERPNIFMSQGTFLSKGI